MKIIGDDSRLVGFCRSFYDLFNPRGVLPRLLLLGGVNNFGLYFMTLLYLQPLLKLRAVIPITLSLFITACAGLTQTSTKLAPVTIAQVVEAPSATALEKPLEVNLAVAPLGTKVLPTVLPKVGLKEVKPPLALASTNQPTDAIAFWLGEAGWAFEQDKLTTPKSDNSYYYLTKVLAKEPNNIKAVAALKKIVERYYELLRSSLSQNKVQQARVFLSRATLVMPKHGQLASMRQLIDDHAVNQSAEVSAEVSAPAPATAVPAMRNQKLLVPTQLLDQQDQLLAQWLIRVAKKAHALKATMLIVAPKDDQVRWLYQTMNSADPEQRIRANIKHSRPARVEVKYLARKDELEVYAN